MKKTALIFLMAALMLLCSCSAIGQSVISVEQNGQSFLVDREKSEISDGIYVYRYYKEGSGVIIEYPNGATYYTVLNMNLDPALTGEYDDMTYVSGDILAAVIVETPVMKSYVTAFFIALAGVFTIASPKVSGFWGGLLGAQKGESSKKTQMVSRIGGVVVVIMAIGYLLF
jgi:hypothetical protein